MRRIILGFKVGLLVCVFCEALFSANPKESVEKIWSKKVGSTRKIVFWSTRPENYVWMQVRRTIDDMLKDKPRRPVKIISARNEYETRQFVISPAPDMKDKIERIILDVTDFVGLESKVISKDNVSVEWLRHTFTVQTTGHKYKKFLPDPLLPINVARADYETPYGKLNEPTNIAFWVTFYVPKNIPAGKYRGTVIAKIKFRSGKEIERKRDVVINVLDITLPHMTHTRTALFTGNTCRWVVRDLARFRISSGKMPDNPKGLIEYGRLMHKLGVQITFVGPWLDMYDALGLTPSYRKGKPPKQALEDCKKYYQWAYPILKREGWLKEAYARLPDEFRKMEVAKKVVEYVKLLREWAPGLKTLATNSRGFPEDVGNFLKDYVDIWCPIDYQRKFYQDRVKEGDQLWPYIHGYAWFASDPIKPLRYFFWRLWVYNANGVCYWCIGPRGKFKIVSYGFIREDDVVPGDGSLYYPNLYKKAKDMIGLPKGVDKDKLKTIPYFHSTRFSLIRDGIEDREYLWLIDNLKDKVKGKLNAHPEIKSRLKDVHKLVKKVGDNFWKISPQEADRIRTRFARLIVMLQELSNQ